MRFSVSIRSFFQLPTSCPSLDSRLKSSPWADFRSATSFLRADFMDDWVERELDGGEYPDNRLKTRLAKLLGDLGRRIGATVPMACQDWAATKAAYRFFSNRRVDEGLILAGHFAATKARFAATTGPTLVLHDTTEFSFTRDNPEAISQISIGQCPPDVGHPNASTSSGRQP
jgi:Transposase DNA-binding